MVSVIPFICCKSFAMDFLIVMVKKGFMSRNRVKSAFLGGSEPALYKLTT